MGSKSAPSPPPAPDPMRVAQADAQANRINQITPFGNLTFSGPMRNTATLTLDPMQQQLVDQRTISDLNLINAGLDRQALLNQNPINLDQFGPIQSDIDLTGINFTSPDLSNLPAINLPTFSGVGSAPQLQTGLGLSNVPAPEPVSRSIKGSSLPIQNTFQQGQAPDLQALQQGVGSTPIQGSVSNPLDIQAGLENGNLPDLPTDMGALRNRVEDEFFSRGQRLLDPVFADQERALRQRLATRGLPEASEAFDRDFTRFSDARNKAFQDLASSAVLTGGAEASRTLGDALRSRGQLFGENVTGGQFANSAAAQAFGQALGQGQFANAAAGQLFGQNIANANLANQARLSEFGAGLQGQQFNAGQSLAGANLANQAQNQLFGQNLANTNVFNQAGQQAFNQALQSGQFGFDQNLAAGQFGNQATQQMFQNLLAGTQFNNQAQAQNFAAQQDLRNQLLSEAQIAAAGQNTASAQNLALQQQLLSNQNAARVQGLNEALGIRGNQFNELASLLGLQQVQPNQMNNFFGPGQVDTLGAFALNQQAQQNAFNAQLQQQQGALGGLFGLGSSLITGMGSAGGLKGLLGLS